MVLDCHIHIADQVDSKEEFARKLSMAGVDGGMVFSYQPASFHNRKAASGEAERRLSQVLDFTRGNPNLYPFFFIDPMEEDALEQVEMAVEAGISGFKVICCHHYPQDDRAMKLWEAIAKKGKPILFHSGILYNYGPSGEYNRPVNFEHLLYIKGLRFALAHISWPWCDELISVFGKWNNFAVERENKGLAELYVDLTPGTPPIYREEALTRLVTVGYSLMLERMIFGTDGTSCYNSAQYKAVIERDREIYTKLGLSQEDTEMIFHRNLLSFVGETPSPAS